jgi:tetratricopeptide (TPR) repeat protein
MDIESLIRHADDALEAGNDKAALAAGQSLVDMRHAYGFEVLARAYLLRDEKTRAIATLQDGVSKAPNVWQLWELLGDSWTDVGDRRRARESYERVLALPNSDSVARAHALTELERFDEAIAIARAALDDSEALGSVDSERARLQYSIAYALWSKGESDAALTAAWDAVSLHPANEDAMWLIREIEQRHSRAAMQFRLIAEGQRDGRRFLVTSEVVADDEQEARDLAMRFEPEDVRTSIVFEEVKKLHQASQLPKGVYWRSDYVFEEIRA